VNQIRLKDVAAKAGVSPATVSLVLNGKGSISQEVREHVMEVVRQTDYRRNVYASAVARRSSSHIAVLISEEYEKAFEWNFIRQIIIALEAVLSASGFFPILIPIKHNSPAKDLFGKVLSSGAGGLCSIHYVNRELFTALEDFGLPVVIINNSSLQDSFSTVCADDFQGAYEGTRRLLELGHRHLAYLEYFRPDLPAYLADTYIGFKKALDERGLPFDPRLKLSVDHRDPKDLQDAAERLAGSSPRPTALFAVDDYVVAQIIPFLTAAALHCPTDLSVIASGDVLDFSEPFVPQITTMRLDTALIGKLSGELLVGRLKGTAPRTQVMKLRETLVERGSCIPATERTTE
jgi:LacI family transcriptional regulator